MPTVSFIMPAYNAEEFIGEAIESAQAQTFADWELVIVDDCSSDSTLAIARRYAEADSRIRVYASERNSGSCYVPRLRAARLAKGKYLSQLDADDRISPGSLQALLLTQQRTGASIVYPTLASFSGKPLMPVSTGAYEGSSLVGKTLCDWQFAAVGGLVDRDTYLHNLLSESDLAGCTDYIDEVETRMMICAAPVVAFCPEAVYMYRENPASITRTGSLRRLSILQSDVRLEQFILSRYGAGSEEDRLVKLHRYLGVVGCMHYLCRSKFTPEQKREGWQIIKSAAKTLRFSGLYGSVPDPMLALMRLGFPLAKAALQARYRICGRHS